MKSNTQILLLPLFLAPLLLGQTAPAPLFLGRPLAKETKLILRISEPGAGAPAVLRLFKNDHPIPDIVLGPVVTNGEVQVTIPKSEALAAGDRLVARQVLNGVESLPATYVVPTLPTPTVEIRTALAFFAHNVVPVTFKITDADEATVMVEQNGKVLVRQQKVDGDEIKKGKVEVTLPAPLADARALTLKVTAEKLGATAGTAEMTVPVEGLQFRFENAPLEGEQELTGKSASYIKGMVIYAFGGAFSQAPIKRLEEDFKILKATNQPAVPLKSSKLVAEFAESLKVEFLPPKKNAVDPELEDEDLAANRFRDALFTDTATVEKGSFKFTLKHRLDAGQRLMLCAVIENEPGISRHVCDRENYVVRSAGIDFGRMRAFFSAGTVLSSGNNSFGKADPYLAFNSDLAIMNNLVSRKAKRAVGAGGDGLDAFRNTPFGWSLHGILDVRLTQAPAEAKSDGGTAAAVTALLGPKAQQAAMMQGGFYAPMRFSGMDWVYNGTQYSAYFAPVVKLGATMLKDGVTLSSKSTQTTVKTEDLLRPNGAAKVNAGDPTSKSVTTTNPLPFYGYGVRLGVMRYDLMGKSMRNRQIAPDNIAYVDLTYGQNGVYRRVGVPSSSTTEAVVTADSVRTTTTTTTSTTSHAIVPGIGVEGRLKLPHLPAQVGVDLFVHRRRPDVAASLDFRFILGFRIDLAKALGRAFGVTP